MISSLALTELRKLGQTFNRHANDVLAYLHGPGTGGPWLECHRR